MADSSITKQALAEALKSLLAEQPFSKVSVGDICKACGMSRKSFYYHFKDKYDLLNWIFYTEFVSRIQPQSSGWQLARQLCHYFFENRAFYRRAFAVRGQNSFSSYFEAFLSRLLAGEMEQVFQGDANIAFYTAFYVDAFSCAVWHWLNQKTPMPAEQFCALLETCITGPACKKCCKKCKEQPETADRQG